MKTVSRWAVLFVMLMGSGCLWISKERDTAVAPTPPSPRTVAVEAATAAETPPVDTRYDFGGFRDPGDWYKGNLHLHSTISDGALDPVPTVEYYRNLGYDFTALTDHIGGFRDKETKQFRPLVYPLDQMNKPGFLVIAGMEYDTNRDGETFHYVVVGPGYEQRLEEGEDLSQAMRQSWDKGAFVFVAHPHWSLDSTKILEDLTFLPALEVLNYATETGEGIRGYSQMYWDRLLRQKKPVLGVAVDDCHNPAEHAGGGWVVVKAKALTPGEIVRALREGKFYFSSGPKLNDVFMDTSGTLHVSCSPVKYVRAYSVVGKVEQVKADPGRSLTHAAIQWDWKPGAKNMTPFVRVECIDENGRTAWTQAVLRQETK